VYEITRFSGPGPLVQAAAHRLFECFAPRRSPAAAIQTLALSGGRIAGPFYDALVAAERAGGVPILAARPVHFLFADERCVPPEDEESNFRLAQARLFKPLSVAPERIHRLRGEAPPAEAAAHADREVRALLPAGPGGLPAIDLVWLGLGEDGHVASLFPGTDVALAERRAVYVPVVGPKPPPQRLTLTYAALAAAREIWVLASGQGKQAALAASLVPGGTTPLARVLREHPSVQIFTDVPAA
jgi:6-phosphogluconolactonase